MQTLRTLALALLLTSLAMAPAYAKRHGGDRPFNHEGDRMEQLQQLKETLELTPQQQTQIRTIVTESRKEMTARRGEVRANRAAVREIFAAATLDQSRLRELLLRQSELRADQLVAQHAMRAKVKQTLTVEQQARWEGVRRQRMEHRGGQAAPGQTSELERGATNK